MISATTTALDPTLLADDNPGDPLVRIIRVRPPLPAVTIAPFALAPFVTRVAGVRFLCVPLSDVIPTTIVSPFFRTPVVIR